MTDIEWTHAPGFKGESWNPIVGCSLESPGCTNCYAMRKAWRLAEISKGKSKGAHGLTHYQGLTTKTNGKIVWTGKVKHGSERLITAPLRWKKPRMIFVNSMGDLFHEYIPDHEIDRIFAIMALCPQHRFLILTKRHERMREYISIRNEPANGDTVSGRVINQALLLKELPHNFLWPLPNVWLGVSAEDQKRANERIPALLATPAALRFISCEPLLGPVDLTALNDGERDGVTLTFDALNGGAHDGQQSVPGVFANPDPRLDWVIGGGESGPGARPPHPDWFRDLRDQCAAAGVPFFFKQWGSWRPATKDETPERWVNRHETNPLPGCIVIDQAGMINVGKTKAGAILDGREHREFPETRA